MIANQAMPHLCASPRNDFSIAGMLESQYPNTFSAGKQHEVDKLSQCL